MDEEEHHRRLQEALAEEEDPFMREQLKQLYNPLYDGMVQPD